MNFIQEIESQSYKNKYQGKPLVAFHGPRIDPGSIILPATRILVLRLVRFMRPSLVLGRDYVMYQLDTIDKELLEQCNQNPGLPLASSIKPLLGKRSERTLYDRMFALEAQQYIEVDRSQKRIARAKITEKGKAAIRGRAESAPYKGTDLQ